METGSARQLATSLLAQHGLSGWRFLLDHGRTRCGACHYATRTISVSRHFVSLNSQAEVENVILHEIAHALVGPGHGHGQRWQQTARAIGARPEAYAPDDIQMPAAKWQIVCRQCGETLAHRHRRSLKLAQRRCGHCYGELRWQENFG